MQFTAALLDRILEEAVLLDSALVPRVSSRAMVDLAPPKRDTLPSSQRDRALGRRS